MNLTNFNLMLRSVKLVMLGVVINVTVVIVLG